ncbi:MAG TPA: lipocalin-like domain-containing protein [Gammaproteobacteria bacterium]
MHGSFRRLAASMLAAVLVCGCGERAPDSAASSTEGTPARDGTEGVGARDGIESAAAPADGADRVPGDSPGGTTAEPRDPIGDGPSPPTGIRLLSSSEGADADFARALAPRAFDFPRDHAAHPRFRAEWWYFTGNLRSGERHYGFELTFFRFALRPDAPKSPSAWAANQVWMAHLAVTDTANGRLVAEERLTRGALGLAGTRVEPFRVWVEDWTAGTPPGGSPHSFMLEARGERIGIRLALDAVKPPTLHGERGLDRKGPEAGNASYYYSLTRMTARGSVEVDGSEHEVQGSAWMDREWSTSALSPGIEGWDWFALQLSDGTDVMLYRLRREDGSASRFSGGSLVDPEGRRTPLAEDDMRLEPLDWWESGRSGIRYPTAWKVEVPSAALDLEVRPYVDDQEIDLTVRYWEGAVRIEGTSKDGPIEGNGYLELAGYRRARPTR